MTHLLMRDDVVSTHFQREEENIDWGNNALSKSKVIHSLLTKRPMWHLIHPWKPGES